MLERRFYQNWVHMGPYSYQKNVFKNVLLTLGSNFHIQNGRHKNSAESENAPYLSKQSAYETK